MVGSYILVDLGYIEVASMSANKEFKVMAHYPVFCHFGKAPKEKFGRPGNHRVNSRKKYQLTPKICTLSQVPTHLYPPHFISAQEAKSAKMAQYPVTDDMSREYRKSEIESKSNQHGREELRQKKGKKKR
jgi:hypothetical protein